MDFRLVGILPEKVSQSCWQQCDLASVVRYLNNTIAPYGVPPTQPGLSEVADELTNWSPARLKQKYYLADGAWLSKG